MILRTTLIWRFIQNMLKKISVTSPGRIPARILRSRILLVSLLTSTTLLSACTDWLPEAHKLDIQQGNNIKLEQVESLEIGMTKSEVRKIMGSPMLSDPFHNQRWDYIYRFIPNKGFERKSLLTLYFEDDMLVKIDDSEYIEP